MTQVSVLFEVKKKLIFRDIPTVMSEFLAFTEGLAAHYGDGPTNLQSVELRIESERSLVVLGFQYEGINDGFHIEIFEDHVEWPNLFKEIIQREEDRTKLRTPVKD